MEPLVARTIATVVGALLVGAALLAGVVFYFQASSTNESQDLVMLGDAMMDAYTNQNYQYGTAAIPGSVVINAGKVPTGMVNGTNLVTRWNTDITLTGATTNFTAALPGVPFQNCVQLMEDVGLSAYLTSISAGTTARTPPVAAPQATTDCGSSGTVTLTLTYTGHR